MTTHISKELAEWLKERECRILCDWLYSDAPTNGHSMEICHRIELSEFHIPDSLPAHSWYDILVTHAKQFWGEEVRKSNVLPKHLSLGLAYEVDARSVLYLLQKNKVQEAEAYVREHSLFANPTK